MIEFIRFFSYQAISLFAFVEKDYFCYWAKYVRRISAY